MKKSLFVALFLGIAMLAGSVPVISNAQAYYGSYSTYGSAQVGCLDLTVYQQFDSTDAGTGGQVSLLQEFLNQTGYLSGVSGTYDAGTVGAVINYQNAYRLPATGTLTPETMLQVNSQSCEGGYGTGGYIAPSYPVTNYPGGSNCYWSGTYNSTYVCRTPGTPVIYPGSPIIPIAPVNCNTNIYNNGYYNNSYNNNYNGYNSYNNASYCGIQLLSLSASYTYNTTSITLKGYGFSPSGNTVYFGNSVISNVYSNGDTLVFSVPTGYAYGTYSITVRNAQGGTSNALSFVTNSGNYWNGNGNYGYNNYNNGYNNNYNNCTNGYGYVNSYNNNCYANVAPSLSSISGPSSVQPGTTNTWSVSLLNTTNAYASLNMNWGDGSTSVSNNQISNTYGNNNSTYTFSHAFLTPGTYVIRVTATGSNGLTAYETYTVTVIGNSYNYNNGSYYSRTFNNFGGMMRGW